MVYFCGCAGSVIEQDDKPFYYLYFITSCGMSCGAEHSSNRAFVSSGKTAHTAHAVFSHAQQSLILCHSQSMRETQEEQEETQVLQVCLGLGRFGHAFATKE